MLLLSFWPFIKKMSAIIVKDNRGLVIKQFLSKWLTLNVFCIFLFLKNSTRQGQNSDKFEKWAVQKQGENWLCRANLGKNKGGKRQAKIKVHPGLEDTGRAAMESHTRELPVASVSSYAVHIMWELTRSSTQSPGDDLVLSWGLTMSKSCYFHAQLCCSLPPISVRILWCAVHFLPSYCCPLPVYYFCLDIFLFGFLRGLVEQHSPP